MVRTTSLVGMMASSSSARVFAHLKERSRSSFVGQHRLDVIVHSRLEHGPKYISLPTLKSTFGVAGLVLTEEEVDYLIKRFADNRGHIEWRRLLVALDVAAPADFTDPDQSFLDCLPQPYRLIVSVLETEIIDRAWAVIVDRHPELDTSPTDEARAAADVDLKRSCPPSVRLHNPHPSPLMEDRRRVAEATAAANADTPEQVEVEGVVDGRGSATPPAGGENGRVVDGDRDGGVDETAPAGTRGGGRGGGMTLLRWDRCGELLFTAGCDGSICLRVADALEHIAVQISSRCGRPTSSNGKEETATARAMWGVTFLSDPVGALADPPGGRSSVRIAAVATSAAHIDGNAGRAEGAAKVDGGEHDDTAVTGEKPPRPITIVSVLEVSVSDANSSANAGFGDATGTGNPSNGNNSASGDWPTCRIICEVELSSSSEAAVACALSPDGRRLAVSLADGRIVTWLLPAFSPLLRGPKLHNSGAGERFDFAGDGTAKPHGDEGDGSASLGNSSTSLAGKDDVAAVAKEAAAGGAPEASATEPPLRLARPEFAVPRLPSPEELAYAKTLQEYRRRVEAGELQEPTPGSAEVEEGCTPPPRAPQLSGCAHHLARVDFLPDATSLDGGSGGLSVWRANSNVWRLYRLPPVPSEGDSGPQDVEGAVNGAEAGAEDAGQAQRETDSVLPAEFDISSLPSAEWILPSPITTLAVSEGHEGGERGEALEDDVRRVLRDEGRSGCDWSCCGNSASTVELAPLVAIGTENGGVFLCDAALGTTREALSRHRARVTTLAFHRKRFLVSGSADEMLQIHHIAAAPYGGVGGSCCGGGTPRLRCLHDARGGEIVRAACLREAALVFAEDTSGRVVGYDLLTGSMLGVLALGNRPVTCATAATTGVYGGPRVAASAETVSRPSGIVWAGGGDRLAAVMFEDQRDPSASSSPTLSASNEELGVWSGSDVMWGLSPGLRAIAGEERPRDVAALFFGLDPAQRKNAEGKLGLGPQSLLPPPSPPAAGRSRTHRSDNDRSRRGATPPPRTGTAGTASRSYRGRGGGGGGIELRTASSKGNLDTERLVTTNRHQATVLTEVNVAKHGGGSGGSRFGGGLAEGGIAAGGGAASVPWRREVGAKGRAKRYMRGRHGGRAARQARLNNAMRNLLHAL